MNLGLMSGIFLSFILSKISGKRNLISFLIILSFLPFVSFFETEIGSDYLYYKLVIRLSILSIVIFYFIYNPKLFWLFNNRKYLPLYLLFALSLLSCFYSFYGWWAFIRISEAIALFVLFVIGFSILNKNYKIQNILWFFTLSIFLPVISILILIFTDPQYSVFVSNDNRIRIGHLSLNANSLGIVASIVIFGCMFRIKTLSETTKKIEIVRKAQVYLVLMASSFVLIFSHSRSAIIAFMIAITLYFFLKSSIKKIILLLPIIIILIFFILAFYFNVLIDYITRGEDITILFSFTGRYDLWAALVEQLLNDLPIFGYGFFAISKEGTFLMNDFEWSSAHNTYINSILYLGIPGFFLNLFLHIYVVLKSLLFCIRLNSSDLRFDIALMLFCVYTILGIVGLSESILTGWPNPMMAIFFLFFPVLTRLNKFSNYNS